MQSSTRPQATNLQSRSSARQGVASSLHTAPPVQRSRAQTNSSRPVPALQPSSTHSKARQQRIITHVNPTEAIADNVSQLFNSWSPHDMPNMSGKVVMVTGGNSGIGFHTVQTLAKKGADVIMVSRSKAKGETAKASIASGLGQEVANRITVLECDLSRVANADRLAESFRKLNKPLYALVLNAGAFFPSKYTRTEDGMELQLNTNYFSHVRLATNLLDIIVASGPSRIVVTGSVGEFLAGPSVDWKDLTGSRYTDSGMVPYGRSKLYILMWAKELQDRLKAQGAQVDIFGIHPGLVNSPLFDEGEIYTGYITSFVSKLAVRVIGLPPPIGAIPLMRTVSDPKLQGMGFDYMGPMYLTNAFSSMHRPVWNPVFYNANERHRLYEETQAILERVAGPPIKEGQRERERLRV